MDISSFVVLVVSAYLCSNPYIPNIITTPAIGMHLLTTLSYILPFYRQLWVRSYFSISWHTARKKWLL